MEVGRITKERTQPNTSHKNWRERNRIEGEERSGFRQQPRDHNRNQTWRQQGQGKPNLSGDNVQQLNRTNCTPFNGKLFGYGGTELNVVGMCDIPVMINKKKLCVNFKIIKTSEKQKPVIGDQTINKLELLKSNTNVNVIESNNNIKELNSNDIELQQINTIVNNHLGINKTISKARETVFWPYMSKEIGDMIQNCITCLEYQNSQQQENLANREVADRPWQIVAAE
ncbi:Integrase zinc binding domain [Popillia japonica]|uniref:RNA-directed DNA polymerase n=1 Tax=Popillia japonica TaxID=7064 RepID=A0AAW1JJQ1_POPJA